MCARWNVPEVVERWRLNYVTNHRDGCETEIALVEGSRVLTCATRNDQPYMWTRGRFVADGDAAPLEVRVFRAMHTHDPDVEPWWTYVGSCFGVYGWSEVHIFETTAPRVVAVPVVPASVGVMTSSATFTGNMLTSQGYSTPEMLPPGAPLRRQLVLPPLR